MIGVGAGLSTSAGFVYTGERFEKHFADLEAKYRFHDMRSGTFCHYDAPEEHWAYWSRFITVNRIDRCFESSEVLASQFGNNRGLMIAYYLTEAWAEFSSFVPELPSRTYSIANKFDEESKQAPYCWSLQP